MRPVVQYTKRKRKMQEKNSDYSKIREKTDFVKEITNKNAGFEIRKFMNEGKSCKMQDKCVQREGFPAN